PRRVEAGAPRLDRRNGRRGAWPSWRAAPASRVLRRLMALWLADAPLILASQSKTRRMLLSAAGVSVEADPADLDERGLEVGARSESAGAIAALLAREKAAAGGREPGGAVAR